MKKEGIFAIGWTILAFCIGVFLVARESGSNVQSIYYGRLPDFHLTDSQGHDFDYEDILGQIWVVQFSKKAIIEFPDLPSEVEKLTILTDFPLAINGNNKSKVVYNDPEIIIRLATVGFHLTKELINMDDSIPLILVDKSGNIRGYYQSKSDKDFKRLSRDIDSLLRIS